MTDSRKTPAPLLPLVAAGFVRAFGFGKKRLAAAPNNARVYAVGDIHGCSSLLDILHEKIAGDATGFVGDKHIVYLGDFIDRGPDSRGVIERVMREAPPGFRSHFIKGNHDAALLDFLADPETYRAWRGFGAGETLLSYGVRPPLFDDADQMKGARDALQVALPETHLEFFRRLELQVTLGDYVFVHAGVRPGVPLNRQSEEDLLWIRDEFLSSRANYEKIVVHGHTPLASPVRATNRISVDTGAYATGILTCAVLEGTACRFVQARTPPQSDTSFT